MPGVKKQNMTLEEVKEIIQKAQVKGAEAAAAKYRQMWGKDRRGGGLRGLCGGAFIEIALDGRFRLARQLRLASQQIDQFNFGARGKNGRQTVHFAFKHRRQEQEVDAAGSEAALAVLKRELQIVGFVKAYYS